LFNYDNSKIHLILFLISDDNFSDADSKIDVGGVDDTDDNNSVHYMMMEEEDGCCEANGSGVDSDGERDDHLHGHHGHHHGHHHHHNNNNNNGSKGKGCSSSSSATDAGGGQHQQLHNSSSGSGHSALSRGVIYYQVIYHYYQISSDHHFHPLPRERSQQQFRRVIQHDYVDFRIFFLSQSPPPPHRTQHSDQLQRSSVRQLFRQPAGQPPSQFLPTPRLKIDPFPKSKPQMR
jgi:hypothetical protein